MTIGVRDKMTTLQAIADELGCSYQYVSCIEKKILNKIKKALQEQGYEAMDLDTITTDSLAHQYFMQQWVRDYENKNIEHEYNALSR